jgi:hypothetical protein
LDRVTHLQVKRRHQRRLLNLQWLKQKQLLLKRLRPKQQPLKEPLMQQVLHRITQPSNQTHKL